ncbi:hypothetical protein JCM10908_004517 [Rhodotorula pacifica]|uniref:pheromone-regulated protein PRM1 n=1 Tax=Rhodotorula pacifica TaxID=1495444 RepID=UPI0031779339
MAPFYSSYYHGDSSLSRRQSPALKPYLGPQARLSLSWLSQHFLALILVLITLSYLLSSIPHLVDEAKDSLGAACKGVEGAASVAVSMPHYMADGVNELNVKAVNAITQGAGTVLDLLLQALEAIVLFMIDMYRSLYLCLLDLAVHGSLTVLVKGIEEAQEFVTEALQGVRTTIQGAVSGVNSGLEHTIGLIDKLPGVDIDVPHIDIPQLSALENVTLPNTLVNALENLNSTIPTLDEFRSSLDSLISRPIEELRSSINSTMRNSSISVELLPVPAKETVQLCQELDTSWIDEVGNDLAKFVKIAIGLVVLAMALFIAANALWEKYRYRAFIGGVDAAREAWLRDLLDSAQSAGRYAQQAHNPAFHTATADETLSRTNLLSFLNASSHPTLFKHISRLSSLLSLRTSNAKANLIWFLSYIADPYAWGFLALGVVGLIVVQIQIAVLDGPIRDLTHKRAEQGAGEFSSSVMETMNGKMRNASMEWANSTNAAILGIEDGINENLFSWVNTTTVTLNSTMNGFYDEITDTITDVFNGTILQDPALGLVYCLVGSKVDAISTALTWIDDHAHLSLPTVSPSILLLSPNRTEDLTSSLTNPESSISAPSIADKMINAYSRSLEQQRMGFFVAIGIWALVFLMGVIGAWWRAVGQNLWRRRRGRRGRNGESYDEKGQFGEGDAEKAGFRPLHLRSFSNLLRSRPPPEPVATQQAMYSLPPPPTFAIEPATPATLSHRSVSPSTRSWASLVDFFQTADAKTSSTASPPSASPSPEPSAPASAAEQKLRPLALPSMPNLRSRAAVSSAKSRLRPIISQPRPLLRPFRVLRDSHLAHQQRRRERRRESDLVLLQDETRSKGGHLASGRSVLGGSRTRSNCADVVDSGEVGQEDWLEADEEMPSQSYPPPPNLPDYHPRPGLSSVRPSSPPLFSSRQSTRYIPSSRPLAATDPFATPFDDE